MNNLITKTEYRAKIDILFTKVVERTTAYVVNVEKCTNHTNLMCKDHPDHQLYVDLQKARSVYKLFTGKYYKGKLIYKV